jgi:hypothetical protein
MEQFSAFMVKKNHGALLAISGAAAFLVLLMSSQAFASGCTNTGSDNFDTITVYAHWISSSSAYTSESGYCNSTNNPGCAYCAAGNTYDGYLETQYTYRRFNNFFGSGGLHLSWSNNVSRSIGNEADTYVPFGDNHCSSNTPSVEQYSTGNCFYTPTRAGPFAPFGFGFLTPLEAFFWPIGSLTTALHVSPLTSVTAWIGAR